MHPDKVKRETTQTLTDLPNVGPKMAAIFERAGVKRPSDLVGSDAVALYETLNRKSGEQFDPCVLDVFLSAVEFMNGGEAKVWWAFTSQRKRLLDH
jgi:HD-GYP domain-containing protein (c-di-GMP phosphodiesterase class II)